MRGRPPATARSTRALGASVLLPLVLAGCAASTVGVGQRGDVEVERQLARRRVVAKEPPGTLVAEDASRCDTTTDRFANVDVGDRVWCYWRGGGALPPRGQVAGAR